LHAENTKKRRHAVALQRQEENNDAPRHTGRATPGKITWPALIRLLPSLAAKEEANVNEKSHAWSICLEDDNPLTAITDPKELARYIANEFWESSELRWV
jgi:hypothetical protein